MDRLLPRLDKSPFRHIGSFLESIPNRGKQESDFSVILETKLLT
jgi:hypothetical protein